MDIIASDAHSSDDRYPPLSKGFKTAVKIVGMENAMNLFTKNPQAIIDGKLFPCSPHV